MAFLLLGETNEDDGEAIAEVDAADSVDALDTDAAAAAKDLVSQGFWPTK